MSLILGKGALMVGGAIAWVARPPTPEAKEAGAGLEGASRALSMGGGWIWPLPIFNGARPTISDGPGTNKRTDLDGKIRNHNGADVDYQRANRTALTDKYRPGTHEGTALFYCPSGLPVVAARDGKLWSASESPRGWQVVIDHGKPWCTYYQHLTRLLVPVRKGSAGGQPIRQGQVIGIVGADPTQGARGFNHVHFEMWQGGGAESWVDPTPFLRAAGAVQYAALYAQLAELGVARLA